MDHFSICQWKQQIYPNWAQGEHVTIWDHESGKIYLRISWEDDTIPVIVSIGTTNSKGGFNNSGESPFNFLGNLYQNKQVQSPPFAALRCWEPIMARDTRKAEKISTIVIQNVSKPHSKSLPNTRFLPNNWPLKLTRVNTSPDFPR